MNSKVDSIIQSARSVSSKLGFNSIDEAYEYIISLEEKESKNKQVLLNKYQQSKEVKRDGQ